MKNNPTKIFSIRQNKPHILLRKRYTPTSYSLFLSLLNTHTHTLEKLTFLVDEFLSRNRRMLERQEVRCSSLPKESCRDYKTCKSSFKQKLRKKNQSSISCPKAPITKIFCSTLKWWRLMISPETDDDSDWKIVGWPTLNEMLSINALQLVDCAPH